MFFTKEIVGKGENGRRGIVSVDAPYFFNMDTVCVTISIQPFDGAIAEVLIAILSEAGYEGFEETDTAILAYIPEAQFRPHALDEWVDSINTESKVSWNEKKIVPQNWNRVWEENYFKPLVIGDRVVVRSPFHTQYPPASIEIVIEPEMAFGTGNHETTSLMMESMLELDFSGRNVCDMGCGTGILAILAAKLGATAIDAIDIDEWSFAATTRNAEINQVAAVSAYLGDVELLGSTRYAILLANIQRNVILADLPRYSSVLHHEGLLLLSGFFLSDLDDITVRAQNYGLETLKVRERNNWVAVLMQKLNS